MRIAFVSGKGGVGKSTLCHLVALALANAGKTVAVEDRDPQKSISSWIDPGRDGLRLCGEAEGVVQGGGAAEFHLIDTCPFLREPSVHDAVRTSDVIVMPCTPSPGDITAARATIGLVDRLKKPAARAALVLNKVRAGTMLAQDAPAMLRELGAPVLATALGDRQPVQKAVLLGWAALDAKLQGEVFKLAFELLVRPEEQGGRVGGAAEMKIAA